MGVVNVVGQRHHNIMAQPVLCPVGLTTQIKLEMGQEGGACIEQHPHLDSSLHWHVLPVGQSSAEDDHDFINVDSLGNVYRHRKLLTVVMAGWILEGRSLLGLSYAGSTALSQM